MTSNSGPTQSKTIDQGLVRALGHPMRVRILEALQGRTASPTELAREFRESLSNTAHHTNVLKAVDCIEEVSTRRRRGTTPWSPST